MLRGSYPPSPAIINTACWPGIIAIALIEAVGIIGANSVLKN